MNEAAEAGRRPPLEPALVELVERLVAANPEHLSKLDPRRILFVAGAARREARASVRPLTFGGDPPRRTSADGRYRKPNVCLGGIPMLYEVCLRPRFFLIATPRERALCIAHEIWHISPDFDGALASERRHAALAKDQYEREVHSLTEKILGDERALSRSLLASQGELTLAAWLTRPPSNLLVGRVERQDYDDRDLYRAIVATR